MPNCFHRAGRLLKLNVGLDALGAAFAWKLFVPQLAPAGIGVFLLAFLAVSWFIGGYFYLRWPLMPKAQVMLRLLLAVLLALASTLMFTPWVVFHAEPLPVMSMAWMAAVFCGLAVLFRLCLRPMVRAGIREAQVEGRVDQFPVGTALRHGARELVLMLVAYHPDEDEVEQLQRCLAKLPAPIGYAVVVNNHHPGEPVDRLAQGADYFLTNRDNPGYGRSVNRLFERITSSTGSSPPYIGILNTDLSWVDGTFSQLLHWLQAHPGVSLAVPQIVDPGGAVQRLCKRNPTLLGLLSRRFLPSWCKPRWLARYDQWYVMADQDYQQIFACTYLSGCCMLVRTDVFSRVGGFDERYFLYLEDADLTRLLSRYGSCVHLPVAQVVHNWGRGNYRDAGLMLVNLISAWLYFRKWGWNLW